jgi:hypothetical protein
MTIQTINLGNYANDGTGDDLRTAFEKVNANFHTLDVAAAIGAATNLGSGTGLYAGKNSTNLEFKSLTSTDTSVVITNTATSVNLQAKTTLANDTDPTLSENLNLNGNYIYGGDTQTTVYGYDVALLNALVEIMIESNNLPIDFGTFESPTGGETNFRGYTFDMGILAFTPPANQINFGTFV